MRLPEQRWQIRPFTRHDRYTLLRYIDQHSQLYYHLDWEAAQQWITDPDNPIMLACLDGVIEGVMAFSPLHHQTSWLRLLGLPHDRREEIALALWKASLERFSQYGGAVTICALLMRPWMRAILEQIGFMQTDSVINLARQAQPLPPPPDDSIKIRGLRPGESRRVLQIDHAAFDPIWQMRDVELKAASKRACYYQVATYQHRVIGYQLSTRYTNSMHLARLATLPAYQGKGIASQLVYDLLRYAEQHQIETVTVNTQLSNRVSQRLYERYGFQRDEMDFPVYSLQLV